MMKKILIALAVVFAAVVPSAAQDGTAVLSVIEKKLSSSKGFSGPFSEVRNAPKKETVSLKGEICYRNEDYIDMSYTNGELFNVDGNAMTIIRDGKTQKFDLNKNLMMKSLSHTLLFVFQGRLEALAQEQNADIEAAVEGREYVVTLTARKKAARGCSKVMVRYRTADCGIVSMQLEEFGGNTTFYSMD